MSRDEAPWHAYESANSLDRDVPCGRMRSTLWVT